MRNACRSVGAGIGIVLALSAAGCAGVEPGAGSAAAGSLADMEPMTLTVPDFSAPEGTSGKALTAFMEQVEKETDGKISFDVYWSSSLMPAEEMLTGIGSGVADLGHLQTSYFPQELPVANFLNDLGSLPNPSFPLGALQGSAAAGEMFAESDALVDEFEGHNLKVLNGGYLARYSLLCTKPLEGVDAAKGTRVRTGGEVWAAEVEAMGMVAVPLPAGELYEGLQRGVVDCAAFTPSSVINFGLWDVAKYFYQVDLSGYAGSAFAINLDTWNALPTEVQEILSDAAIQYRTTLNDLTVQEYARFAADGVDAHEVVFGDPRPFDAVLADFQGEWIPNVTEGAPGGLSDPEGFVNEFRASLDKWETILSEDLGVPEFEKSPEEIRKSFVWGEDFDIAPVQERFVEELK